MDNSVEGLERIAGLTPEGVLAIVILGALLVFILYVNSLRNQNTTGLTDALRSLSDALKSNQSFQGSMEIEFRRMVENMTKIIETVKEIIIMRGEVSQLLAHVKERQGKDSEAEQLQQTILIRLDNIERTLNDYLKDKKDA